VGFTCAHAINCMNVYVWLIFHYFCFYYLCKLVCIQSVHSKCTCFIGLIVCYISFFPTMHIVQLLFSFCIIIFVSFKMCAFTLSYLLHFLQCIFLILHIFFLLIFTTTLKEGWMVVALDGLDYEVRDVILSIWHSIVQLKKPSSKAFVN